MFVLVSVFITENCSDKFITVVTRNQTGANGLILSNDRLYTSPSRDLTGHQGALAEMGEGLSGI